MVTTATAVPQVHSTPLMKTISEIEQKRVDLEMKFEIFTNNEKYLCLFGLILFIILLIIGLIHGFWQVTQFLLIPIIMLWVIKKIITQ